MVCGVKSVFNSFPTPFTSLLKHKKPHEPALQAFKKGLSNIDYVLAAAGDKEGEIFFDAGHLFGGQASHAPFGQNNITVPVTTVDIQVAKHKLQPPFLLKLDTHGFELPILAGAEKTLRQTALIVIETYNFQIAPDSLRFHEICAYLEDRGFRCVDICDPLHRPR